MKPMDYSVHDPEAQRRSKSELFSEATHELPANRKARRDVMRRNGEFKKKGRWGR